MMKQSGMTILELVIVIIILSIIGVTVVSSLPSNSIKLQPQAQQLINDLRYIQFNAITKDKNYKVTFTSNKYSFSETNGNAVAYPADPSSGNSVSLDQDIMLSTIGLPNGYVVFNQIGVPYIDNAMTTPLSSDAIISLTANGQSRGVRITAGTGLITSS